MSHKYEVEKENGKWEFYNCETQETKIYKLFGEILNALKSDKGNFTVLDRSQDGMVWFEDGKAVCVESEYGHFSDKELKELYLGVLSESEDEEEIDCVHCGDCGCVYCYPATFL